MPVYTILYPHTCTHQLTKPPSPSPHVHLHSPATQRVLLTTWTHTIDGAPPVCRTLLSLEHLFKRLYNAFDMYVGECGSEVMEVSEEEYSLRAEVLHALLSAVKDLCSFRILGMMRGDDAW